MRVPESVVYPESNLDTPLFVERLRSPDVTTKAAREVMALMFAAYTPVHEEPNGPLPQGALKQRFDPDNEDLVHRQADRMSKHIADQGSQYWLLRIQDEPDDLLGLAKITPSGKPHRPHQLNDIAIDGSEQGEGSKQGKGFGRVLMHCALKFGLEPDVQLSLAGYKDSEIANSWYERLGLVYRGQSPTGVSFGSHEMPLVLYHTPEGTNLSHIIDGLEQRVSELTKAEPKYSITF